MAPRVPIDIVSRFSILILSIFCDSAFASRRPNRGNGLVFISFGPLADSRRQACPVRPAEEVQVLPFGIGGETEEDGKEVSLETLFGD